MTTTLEQSFVDLTESAGEGVMSVTLQDHMTAIGKEHRFYAVSVGFNTGIPAGLYWSANVHWKGFARGGITCASGIGGSPEEALAKAVEAAAKDREPYADNSEREYRISKLREQLEALTGASA